MIHSVSAAGWDSALLISGDSTSLVSIARDRRLVLDDGKGPRRVDLCWVDAEALALIDLAHAHGRDLTIVYPAPAGQVAVLLTAQILLREFLRGTQSPSVGLVTADTTSATRTWNALRISTTGERVPIADVFPSYRAGPEGDGPNRGARLQGVIIGQQCKGWPVDHLVVDHLAGLVSVHTNQPSIEVYADPLDRGLRHAETAGRLIWGWSAGRLAGGPGIKVSASRTVPFSVAADLLATVASGIDVHLRVAKHPQAEAAAARVREDLRHLRSMSPDRTDRNLERGLSAAWHHLTTLISLPSKPSHFDRFAGLPPIGARATNSFSSELTVWASTLADDLAEIATILASDIADLRAELERGNPFEDTLRRLHEADEETLVITRTRTARNALLEVFGGAPTTATATPLVIESIGGLHRLGTYSRALMIGEPSPWDWHRLLGGLASTVDVLTLGEQSALICAASIDELHAASERWGGDEICGRTWRSLLGTEPPCATSQRTPATLPIVIVDGAEYVPEPDPFEALVGLFELDPLDLGGEGPASNLAREGEYGDWTATVPAVAVTTDRGVLLLEIGRPVDVREGPRVVEKRPESLGPGAVLLVGRRQGRIGLLEALEERLRDRPDLMAARFLIEHYRHRVRSRFAESGLTISLLHRLLSELGCDKTPTAVRSWVSDTTMAPQHLDDLKRLNQGLELGFSALQIRELFAGVQRRRGFRRAAGRALAAAARGSMIVDDENRVDAETGLSIADLREAIIEAVVISITQCDHAVPLTLLGRLEN